MASCWLMRRPWLAALIAVGACQPAASDGEEPAPPVVRADASSDASSSSALTCSHPVERGDTMASLQARFGGDARAETLGGPEGSEFAGLVLWPDDPSRRLEVFLTEDGTETVSFVRLGQEAEWQVAGLGLGDPPARVREVNGRPFTFSGFSWDYGGYVTDWSGGRLTALPGDCTVSLRFDVVGGVELPEGFLGESSLSSDDPRTATIDARVIELGLGFPPTDRPE